MFRGLVLVAFLVLLPAPGSAQAAASEQQPGGLLEAQALLDSGKFREAESSVRVYLTGHAASADAHYLLAYILFREANPKASLLEYAEAALYRPPAPLDLMAIGCNYFLLEDYPSADRWLTKAVNLNPANALAQFYFGRVKFNEQRFEEAIRAFTECLRFDPNNVRAADNLGLAYEAEGKTADALDAYQTAVTLDTRAASHDSGPYLNLGTLLVQTDHAADALPHLLQAARIAPGDARTHRELGKGYLQLDRLDDARGELEKALELSPENAPAHFLLAQVYRKQGLADQARVETARYSALTGAHSAPGTPLQEARSLLSLGNLRDAERVARGYLDLHQTSGEGHFLLGYILFKKQDPKASLAEYTEGAKYRKPAAADLQAVASDYVLLKDYTDADKWFTRAVQWNPNDALGWYYLGRTKYNENRFDEAIQAFEKCLLLEPRNVKAQDNLGLAYEGLNRIDEAATAYRAAISWQAGSSSQDAGPYLDLGSLLVNNDRAGEGLPLLLQAAAISARDYRVHRQLGKAYSYLNQLPEARAEFEKAIELEPRNASIHFMLAQVYRRQGLLEKAKVETELYARLAESNPAPDR